MKLDRNHVKGDLNQQIFKNIIQYTILKECKYLIPIVHIVTHECNSLITQKTDSASSMNAPPSSHNTITTPLQTCSKTKKYSKNQNCGLYSKVCSNSSLNLRRTNSASIYNWEMSSWPWKDCLVFLTIMFIALQIASLAARQTWANFWPRQSSNLSWDENSQRLRSSAKARKWLKVLERFAVGIRFWAELLKNY